MAVFIGGKAPTTIKRARSTITFADVAGEGRVGTNVTVFTITGRVKVKGITAYCTTNCTKNGSATMSLGTASVVAAFLAATDPTVIDVDEWWHNTTPTAGAGDILVDGDGVPISEDIDVVPAEDDISGGVIVFDVWYEAITSDGRLT